MDTALHEHILTTDVPTEMKTALQKMVRAAEAVIPSLNRYQQRRYPILLNHMVKEAIDPAMEPQWWEITLNLWGQAARQVGKDGSDLLAAIETLQPLLKNRLGAGGEVTLREITMDTMMGICLLSDTLTEPKKNFVAPNVYSLAQAHFHKYAWFRAIYSGKAPVGFIMIVDGEPEEDKGGKPVYFLWRFMIAEPFHGCGYGRQAIQRLVEYVRTRPQAQELLVSCGQGEGSPQGFYETLGFALTGEVLDEEVVLRLPLE
jgi:diamine N-acetyltransferase